MNKEDKENEEYLNELDLKLNEKDIILNRNIEYCFILEQEINKLKKETKALKQKINTKEQEVNKLQQKINNNEKTLSKIKKENELIKSTISWRITKPLRYINKFR